MKLTTTQAGAIASQLIDEQKQKSDLFYKTHLNSPKVKTETDRLFKKIEPLIRERKLRVEFNGCYSAVTCKADVAKSVANETYTPPVTKQHGIVVSEIIVAAISCDNVEQIKKKIKVTY